MINNGVGSSIFGIVNDGCHGDYSPLVLNACICKNDLSSTFGGPKRLLLHNTSMWTN
jgi:hypothetical protein